MWRGKLSSGVSALWQDMLAADLAERVPELALPAYFFHGICRQRAARSLMMVRYLQDPLRPDG